jgi:hypothetical protein
VEATGSFQVSEHRAPLFAALMLFFLFSFPSQKVPPESFFSVLCFLTIRTTHLHLFILSSLLSLSFQYVFPHLILFLFCFRVCLFPWVSAMHAFRHTHHWQVFGIWGNGGDGESDDSHISDVCVGAVL